MYKELIGSRIILRKISKSDAKSLYENARDKEVCEAVPLPMPYTLKSAQDYVKLTNEFWKKKKEAQFGIQYNEAGKIIGMMGLMSLDFKNKKAEAGYWIGKNYWGKGIAKEALVMLLKYAFNDLKLERVYAKVYSENMSSQKLLEKCNFKLEGRLRKDGKFKGKFDDLLIFGILKSEFKNQ